MIIHFHGSGIALQGIQYIREARRILQGERGLTWQIFDGKPWVPFDQLVEHIKRADIVLGIFGTTRKAGMVIPNKVYEALAVGKPIITADTPAIRELLNEESACLVPAGNPRALADAILRLRKEDGLREKLAANGHAIFTKFATPKVIVSGLLQNHVLFP